MSLIDIKAAREALVALVTSEAGKHIRALQSLGCDVKVDYAGMTIIDTFAQPDALLPGRRRAPSVGRRDIAGMTGYLEKLDALLPGQTATIKVPKELDVGDVLGPVYGGCNRRFGAGNYTVAHDEREIIVERLG